MAASNDIRDYFDNQKTFCDGCGGLSVSGITCEHRSMLHGNGTKFNYSSESAGKVSCKSPSIRSIATARKNRLSNARFCEECFEDLTVVPNGAPCPTCTHRIKLDRKLVLFKSKAAEEEETQKVRHVIKSIFEDIFLETKDQLVVDWQRLKRTNRVCKKTRVPIKCNRKSLIKPKKNPM